MRTSSDFTPCRPSPVSLFVLDASVAVVRLLSKRKGSRAEMALMRRESDEAVVPHLWRLALRKSLLVATRRGRLSADGATERLNALRDLPVRTDTEPGLSLAFVLAEKHDLTFCDAVYLELAVRYNAPIATLDKALARAADAECLPVLAGMETLRPESLVAAPRQECRNRSGHAGRYRWPRGHWGRWNRPAAIWASKSNGIVQLLPTHDCEARQWAVAESQG